MKRRGRTAEDPGLVGLGLGLASETGAVGSPIAGTLLVVPSQLVMLQIPASDLRNFADGMFPSLATNHVADSVRGYGHRYVAGHDLLLDVPDTLVKLGPGEALKQAGHVLLTDFPTKAGIPIPGFSQSGLGQLVERAGISSGWLQLNMTETGVGILAVADGATALAAALDGNLVMDSGTFLETFGAGTVELGIGLATENPLLSVAGIENILAGFVSTWETISVYVDPVELLGAAGTSALLGFAVALALSRQSPTDAALSACRSGTVGALYSVSSAFGFAAVAGFLAIGLGRGLGHFHNAEANRRIAVNDSSYRLLVEALASGSPRVVDLLHATVASAISTDPHGSLSVEHRELTVERSPLPSSVVSLPSDLVMLNDRGRSLLSRRIVVPDDPVELRSIYSSIFSM